ncbi:G2/mitotic-specific cyclin C13-1-like isoform X2 [Henckelia pumila]|uniref:G2/mitotic-specific cyclin C13-1-like isoform X2 n=1 Tax=Henckelia pumila TaxID=405737 RepID=UPI003C6DE023
MADRENRLCERIRESRKRVYESTQPIEKRTVLGELTNNIAPNGCGLNLNPGPAKSRKRKPEPAPEKEEVGIVSEEKVDDEIIGVNVAAVGVRADSDELPGICNSSPMYQHLHSLEVKVTRRPLSNYMEKVQKDIKPVMREVLIDWLVEVAEEYKFVSDTLYLTVAYIDRYLSSGDLKRNKLQLLGVSCMLIAAKYEEISPPNIEDFCYITDNTYTKEEVVDMERDILKFLDFELGNPTIKTFLRILTRVAQEEPKFSTLQFDFLCCYLAELSLLEYRCIQYIPSKVAASTIFLSRFILQPNCHPWSQRLQQYTGYKPFELKDCVLALHYLQLKAETSAQAVRKKYMDHKFKCVASLDPPSKVPASYFKVSSD